MFSVLIANMVHINVTYTQTKLSWGFTTFQEWEGAWPEGHRCGEQSSTLMSLHPACLPRPCSRPYSLSLLQFAAKGRPDALSLSWAHPLGQARHFPYNDSCCSANTMSALCARPCLPHSRKSGTNINSIGKGPGQAYRVPARNEVRGRAGCKPGRCGHQAGQGS